MHLTTESASQQWMSLWLAAIQARVDVAVREAAGRRAEDARALVASLDQQLERLRPEVAHIPAAWLCGRLGLSRTEETVVWTLVASAASPSLRAALCTLGGGQHDEPTLDVIQQLVYREPELAVVAWRELGADGVLARLGLVTTNDADRRVPAYRRPLQVADRVRGLVLGDPALAAAVADLARIEPPGVPADQVVTPADAIATARAHAAAARPFVVAVGPTGTRRRRGGRGPPWP